ncbi:MAG: inorganic pyrophosphatase [Deltaproteobacteria bacterium]|nr:inorganic pyrophosphatase [Deltaproteobacteria bacterium]
MRPVAPPLTHRPHPWHGLSFGDGFPEVVTAYIEIVPSDGVKYEIDKHTGYLKVDRPQRFSSACPTLYGFVPRTYSASRVANLVIPGSPRVTQGDEDPLDICVLADRPIPRGDILLKARPIGGLRMVERGEADDKVIAVLVGDPAYGHVLDVSELPRAVIDRLRHYFLTYKTFPGETESHITVDPVYGAVVAHAVLRASAEDYTAAFGDLNP